MKKLITILTAFAILITVLCFSVSAEENTYSLKFEDFEDDAVDTASFALSSWEVSNIEEKDGNKVLKLKKSSGNAFLRVPNQSIQEGETYTVSYDFMLTELPTTGETANANKTVARLGQYSSGGYDGIVILSMADGTTVFSAGSNNTKPVEKDKWYRLILKKFGNKEGNGKVGYENGDMLAYLIDDEGTELYSYSYGVDFDANTYHPWICPLSFTSSDMVMLLDNLMFSATTVADEPKLVQSTVENGAEGVLRNEEIRLLFDQEFATTSSVTITDEDGAPAQVSVKMSKNAVKIKPTGIFEKGMTYTISFENVKNLEGLACEDASISFKTEETSHLQSPPSISKIILNDNGKLSLSFTLNHPYNYPVFSGALAAAVYDENGSMIGFDLLPEENTVMGTEIERKFAISAAGAKKVKLMVLEADGHILPLAVGEAIPIVTE